MRHGVYIYENETSIIAPVQVDSAIPVVIGTAPVNQTGNTNVGKPYIAYNYQEAVQKLGYSDDFKNYTLCEAMYGFFRLFNIAPVIFINVLDVETHKKTIAKTSYTVANNRITITEEGVIPETLVIKAGAAALVSGIDYSYAFTASGQLIISKKTSKFTGSLEVSYDVLDPSAVDVSDVIGGYNVSSGISTGLELVDSIFNHFGVVPGQICAPGWSDDIELALLMAAKADSVSALFKCMARSDISTDDARKYDDAISYKSASGLVDNKLELTYPLTKVGDRIMHMSTIWSGITAETDGKNKGIPYVSPSNKLIPISGLCDESGKEMFISWLAANSLNAQGICTAINFQGWRSWGNYTSAYPTTTDIKDAFIPVRRMFNWHANTFLLTYFQKVDSPISMRLIESIIESENLRIDGFKAIGAIAGGRMTFDINENPVTNLLGGKIAFHQYLAFFPPAQEIENTLEYDPDILVAALGG